MNRDRRSAAKFRITGERPKPGDQRGLEVKDGLLRVLRSMLGIV
jgi:hypothetical protein